MSDLTTRGTVRVRKPKVARPTHTDALIGNAISQAFGRAIAKGQEFPIDEIDAMIERAGGRCELTGIPFSAEIVGRGRCAPWLPTVDRIDSGLGYVAGNIRLVCWAANRARGDWDDALFWQMVESAYRHRHG